MEKARVGRKFTTWHDYEKLSEAEKIGPWSCRVSECENITPMPDWECSAHSMKRLRRSVHELQVHNNYFGIPEKRRLYWG